MARFAVKGVDEYALKLSKMGDSAKSIAGKAIYGAADVVADRVKDGIASLEAVHDKYNLQSVRKKEKAKLSIAQKKGLLDSFGITKMNRDAKGFYNVKLGFDGYNSVKTKKYPKGQPNQLIARVVENGSSHMDSQPFMRPAVNATRKAAREEMQRVIDEECAKIMNK